MLKLAPNGKYYVDDSGIMYPRVTDIINTIIGINYSKIPADILAHANEFGENVHKMISLDINNLLDESTLDAPLLNILFKWRLATKDYLFIASEQPVFFNRGGIRFAGTLDAVAVTPKGITLIEIKTGQMQLSTHSLQVAAYKKAYNSIIKDKDRKIKYMELIYLRTNASGNKCKILDSMHYNIFLQCLNLYNWVNGKC